MRNRVFKVELAKPAVGEVQLDLLCEPALGADAVAVADDEHAQHQLGINGGPANGAVVRVELLVEVG
jgi:hypothetical protein